MITTLHCFAITLLLDDGDTFRPRHRPAANGRTAES